jgi:predicted MFS family arabinose efflux permease
MAFLAASSALYILVESGFTVIGPLWATRDLGLDNAAWAQLRSISALGGFVSILTIGIIAERLGARWTCSIALAGAGLAMAGLGTGIAVLWSMAALGAFVSIIYVSYNTLAQRVSTQRRSLANTIYRAAGATAAIAAPAVATSSAQAFGAYAPVLAAAAAVLGLAGLIIAFFSDPDIDRQPRRSLASTLSGYAQCLKLRSLMTFVAVTRGFGAASAAVSAFAALRFTRELGVSDPAFGIFCSFIAIGVLLAVIASGWIANRLGPSRTLALVWSGCCLAAAMMGFGGSLVLVGTGYALFVPLVAMCSVPLSLWSSRIAEGPRSGGPSQTTVFTVQKAFQSGTTMVVMALLAILEPVVGMGTLMWCGGLLGLPMVVLVLRIGKAQNI